MINIVISITVFMIVIVAHELAHGYTAYRLGDTTARDAGRLTLNPVAHADPVGTILLPALLILARSPVVFGWAKPVPINPLNFRNPRKGMLLTGLAGPAANFALAVIFAAALKTGIFGIDSLPGVFLLYGVIISLVLGVFNLIPVPPLDGAHILFSVLPVSFVRRLVWLERYGFIALIALLYLGLLDRVIIPLVGAITRVLLG